MIIHKHASVDTMEGLIISTCQPPKVAEVAKDVIGNQVVQHFDIPTLADSPVQ
jgi:hypothetical protein